MGRCIWKRSQITIGIIVVTFFLLAFLIESPRGRNSTNPVPDASNSKLESQLKKDAQKALDAIDSNCTLTASYDRAKQGQHVFNKGLLKFHYNVLKDLLEDVGGYEQLKNLERDLMIPLSPTVKRSISTMVADFGSHVMHCADTINGPKTSKALLRRSDKEEFYVDYNACVFGVYVRELRKALVVYLKANTSVNENDGNGIQETLQRVQLIADQMVINEVYVDPMACDHWLKHNHKRESLKKYNQVRDALKSGPMFQNILQAFQNVSDKIRDIRMSNSG